VAEFSLATSRRWNDRGGQQQEKTEWHRIVAWSALADIAEQYLKKGDKVYVEGEIQYRSFEGKDGTTRYVTEINARELVMLGGRDGGGGSGGGFQQTRRPQTTGAPGGGRGERAAKSEEPSYEDFGTDFPEEDDLPF
jgi:single-strand DNA-binding protein